MAFHFRTFLTATALTAGLAACSGTGTTVSSGGGDNLNRKVLISNQTGRTIYRFYGSNVNRTSWEEDILGNSVLTAGSAINIDFDDGSGACMFDFKTVFADGGEFIENNINVCSVSTYTLR